MNTFILGLLIGGAAVGLIAALVFINQKLKMIIGVLQVVVGKVNKIEKTSEASLTAAENFVDALHQSAEGMMFGPGRKPQHGPSNPADDFQELRETFEEGIRDLEEDSDDEEEDWKKGT